MSSRFAGLVKGKSEPLPTMLSLRTFAAAAILIVSTLSSSAQDKEIVIRALLHDPVNPVAHLFVGKPGGTMSPVEFVYENFSKPVSAPVKDGNLSLFTTEIIDPEKPLASLAATAKVPAGTNSLIAVLVPSGEEFPPYKMALINDEPSAFPWGESKALNLTSADFAIEVGEHKLLLPGGKLTAIPEVRKLNEYNRAQTNFHYKHEEKWLLAAERQMQYVKQLRRLFILYRAPSAVSPDVLTVVDQLQPPVDKKSN